MTTYLHALGVDLDKCTGKLACMRVCPTDAIRVRQGKVQINDARCIDCGECIVACPEGAIKPRADCWDDVGAFPYKVAIPSPTLYGQFPMAISPADVFEGLLAIGFDAVYDNSIESELVNLAIQDYISEYKGPWPLISSTCPVVVRLIQVSYPNMVGQIVPIEPPRELAAREMKRLYSEKLGIPPENIGAIYIAPCPAKMISIKQPAEGVSSLLQMLKGKAKEFFDVSNLTVKSYLDLAISIHDIYNPLLSAITRLAMERKGGLIDKRSEQPIKSPLALKLAMAGGQCSELKNAQYISVSQLTNIIHIFDDIEKGKIKNIHFVEAHSCLTGCIGGPLTVDERFVARSKIQRLIEMMEVDYSQLMEEVKKRYVKDDYFIRQPCLIRPTENADVGFMEQIKSMKIREQFIKLLPGINCGLCGAPRCEVFADDVAKKKASPSDCPLLSDKRIEELRKIYIVADEQPYFKDGE